jgi:hypothetical protein
MRSVDCAMRGLDPNRKGYVDRARTEFVQARHPLIRFNQGGIAPRRLKPLLFSIFPVNEERREPSAFLNVWPPFNQKGFEPDPRKTPFLEGPRNQECVEGPSIARS